MMRNAEIACGYDSCVTGIDLQQPAGAQMFRKLAD